MESGAIWEVLAEEYCESSGGSVTLLILTPNAATPPDVQDSFRRRRNRDSCVLGSIHSIRLLGTFQVEGFLLIDFPSDR